MKTRRASWNSPPAWSPSIKDLLAMDKAANSSEKRKKRKDKKKGKDDGDEGEAPKQKMTAEVKAERDYKRLKSYTDKKAGGSAKTDE
ncbi:hypothetical protein C8R44DRAFT_66538 [Mycena epipterygia]|nr:hypothetical protein C8R44DRAFT_66538 [Mycena epipterygia]